MRIVIPLFHFQCIENVDFTFSDARLSIKPFTEIDLAERDLFSAQDKRQMSKEANYALIADAEDVANIDEDVNLLLMTFRIVSNGISPFMKFKLCENEEYENRWSEIHQRTFIKPPWEVYNRPILEKVDDAFEMIRNAELNSISRLKNALFFLYRAFHHYHWMDAFASYMNTLEALFSTNDRRGATATICRRVSNLLKDPQWTKQVIDDLYNTRSRIVHGNIDARSRAIDNLEILEKMERLTIDCFRKIISEDAFRYYIDEASREKFVTSLD